MPRVLIPETAEPYLRTGVMPTHARKTDFEAGVPTLASLLQMGEALGSSRAVGELVNLGEDFASRFDGMGDAISKAAQREKERERLQQVAGDEQAEANWQDFRRQPTLRAFEKAREVGIEGPDSAVAKSPYIGRQVDETMPAIEPAEYPVPPVKPAQEQPRKLATGTRDVAPGTPPDVAKLLNEYNDIVDYLRATPAQRSNPLHTARLDSLAAEIKSKIAAGNVSVEDRNRLRNLQYDADQAWVDWRKAVEDKRVADEKVAAADARLRGAGDIERARKAGMETAGEFPAAELPVNWLDMSIEERQAFMDKTRAPISVEGAMRGVTTAIDRYRGRAPAATPSSVTPPSGTALSATPGLSPRDLPKTTDEGVPGTAEDSYYSASRGLSPAPVKPATGVLAAPPAKAPAPKYADDVDDSGGAAVPPISSKISTYEEAASLATQADTPAKRQAVFDAVRSANIFRPRTLFERMSGEHIERGMRQLAELMPKPPSGSVGLGMARLEQQQKQFEERERRLGEAAKSKAAQDAKRFEGLQKFREASQRNKEFEIVFEHGEKFAETKRHNLAMERAAMANAAANNKRAADPTISDARRANAAQDALSEADKALELANKPVADAKKAEEAASVNSKGMHEAARSLEESMPRTRPNPFLDEDGAKAYDKAKKEVDEAKAAAAKAAAVEAAWKKRREEAEGASAAGVAAAKAEQAKAKKELDAARTRLLSPTPAKKLKDAAKDAKAGSRPSGRPSFGTGGK